MTALAIDNLKNKATKLLNDDQVKMVIGYGRGTTAQLRRPIFIKSADQLDALVLDGRCEDNLAVYLTRPELIGDDGKIAIFVNPAGIRTINVLAAENQIDPQRVILLAFEPETAGQADAVIKELPGSSLNDFTELLAKIKSTPPVNDDRADKIAELEAMSAEQRFEFWRQHFANCIKCYACRAACPMCYCRRCVADQNQPQWLCTSAHELGNFEWNVVRAFHLAGRCVECGNCQRACPVDIPLMLLNRRLAREAREAFDYCAGISADQPPALASFKQDDPENFIL